MRQTEHASALSEAWCLPCSYYDGLGHGNLTHQTFIEEGKMEDPKKKEQQEDVKEGREDESGVDSKDDSRDMERSKSS